MRLKFLKPMNTIDLMSGKRIFEVVCNFILISVLCIFFVFNANHSLAKDGLLTVDDIKRISPGAKDALAEALANASVDFSNSGINTRLRMAHFVAQVMTETGGLKRLDENMNYRYATLLRVFSRRTISESKAREIAGKPREIANWVYGARLGNLGRQTDDGWNYRGSGYIQLTGRSNFRKRGKETGLPLEEQPELARRAREGLRAALAYWKARNVSAAADDNDRRRVRILVNGPAAHGLKQSNIWFNRAWTRVFRAKAAQGFETNMKLAEAAVADETLLFNELLKDGGIVSRNLPATEAGNAIRVNSIKAYQRELGLPETGILDEATREELLDPREWRHRERTDAELIKPRNDPEGSVSFSLPGLTSQETSNVVLSAFEGTGETLDNPTMPREMQNKLEGASSIYAQYEMGEMRSTPERFVPYSVVGDDDRVIVRNTTTFPERAIVQILFDSGVGTSLCSGTMVSADTVLTAAHCIHSGTSSGYMFSDFKVVPGRNGPVTPYGQCNVISAKVLSGWVSSQTSLEARYYDLGALKLNCKIGEKTGWLGVRSVVDSDVDTETIVHGYAADKAPPGRQWVSIDKLRVLWEKKGFYKNDTFGGTSGAPVFIDSTSNTVVGVHTNGLHGDEPWASHNAFTRITPARLKRIAEWIAN